MDIGQASGQASPVVDGRLRHQYPRLADWLEAADHAQRVDRVRLLSEHAADATAVSDRCIAAERLDALVETLDEVAWTIQEAVDDGSATSEEYEYAFRRARAANAWAIAHVDSSLEGSSAAVYEVLAALGGSESAVLTILNAE